MRRPILARLGIVVLAAAVAGGVLVGSATAEKIHIGNIILTVNGGFKPKKLPKKKRAPIALNASGKVKTDDGSAPPRAKVVTVDFDKNGTLTTKGIKTCKMKKILNSNSPTAKRQCKKSLVGQGTVNAVIAFPEDEPFNVKGPLLMFNGQPKGKGKKKKPTIIFHTFLDRPLPTAYVTQATVVKSPIKGMGKRVKVNIPAIAGGNGTLTSFKVKVNRKPATGKKYVLARCKNRRLKARGQVNWIALKDRPAPSVKQAKVDIVRKCKKK